MSSFELYIHGTPKGHQIWGSEKNHDYIGTFYNHDSSIQDKSFMQIDICMGDSYYTYVRSREVYDVDERPGSYFAMTLCFPRSFCSNTYKLYQIFEAVYCQICIGTLIQNRNNKEIYAVSDLETSLSGPNLTVEKIRAIFNKNIPEMILPSIHPLVNVSDTFNKGKKAFSLVEVDSPLFIDTFKKQSIIVLPSLEPSSVRNQSLTKLYNEVVKDNKSLDAEKSSLKKKVDELSAEIDKLSKQIKNLTANSESKFSSEIKQLKAKLAQVSNERDELKSKIERARTSVELIDKPVQNLCRLMAVRFHEDGESLLEGGKDKANKNLKKDQAKIWSPWINPILLCLVVILCTIILLTVIKKDSSVRPDEEPVKKEALSQVEDLDTVNQVSVGSEDLVSSTSGKENFDSTKNQVHPQEVYDKLEECMLSVIGCDPPIDKNKLYTLKVYNTIRRRDAKVPDGEWCVWIEKGTPINKTNTFTVPNDICSGTNVMIEYKVNNETIISRTVKVK